MCMISCSEKKPAVKYPVIDVVNNTGNYQRVYCSDYFSSIEIIPLETNRNCFIGEGRFPILNDSFIFISGGSNGVLYVFDRHGKFLNQIGAIGRGPGEYLIGSNVFLNQDTPSIFIADYSNIIEYEFNGKFIGSFQKPSIDNRTFYNCSYVGNDLFVGQLYYDGKQKYKYGLFDRNGNVIKGFPSHYFFSRNRKSVSTFDGTLSTVIDIDFHR